MNLLTLEAVSKQYSERLLLDRVDLIINQGDRIGLIGVNGSGKSTLLRIVAGLEQPDAGSVTVWGGMRTEYLSQEPTLDDRLTVLEHLFRSDSPPMRLLRDYEWTSDQLQQRPYDGELQQQLVTLSAEMDRLDGWTAEANAKAILTRLGITDFAAPVATLSGGQRKRVALARALIDRADLLVLDEPTNHIDADTIAWLEEYLATAPGALLMVTHDRYFLDRVVNRIVELDRRDLVNYAGNYSRYLELREARHQRLVQAEEKHQNLLRRELEWLRRGAMARSTKQKARKQRVEELQRINHDRGEETVALALGTRRLGKKVLEARNLGKRYGDVVLFHGIDFQLDPGDRIGIVGPNGAGKSTFLDVLAGKTEPDTGSVIWGETVHLGYFDQRSADLDGSKRVIEFIEEDAPLIQTRDGERITAAQMLEWFLFPRPQQWAQIASLSGGERRRLYLLHTLIHRPNVLFLDEPTNDLDIQTLTVLEEFLDQFQGCLIVVSHDRYFLDRTVDHIIPFEVGRVGLRYPAPYETYRRLRQESESRLETSGVAGSDRDGRSQKSRPSPSEPRREPAERKLSWKEARELESLETQIGDLERRREHLHAEMNASGGDFIRLQTLGQELQEVETILETAMERWLELAEVAQEA